MTTNRMKIEVNSLKEGMFVADLDRPWHQTPFPLQGFYIRTDDDVKALAGYCKFVYVDVQKEKSKSTYARHEVFNPGSKSKTQVDDADANVLKLPPIVIKKSQQYQASSTIKKEVSRVSKLHQQVYDAIDKVFSSIQSGGDISVSETASVADGMVESVVRNPDALVWLSKMSDQDAHGYQHSVKASIWALVFGRHLGLEKKLLKTLAMGVLLAHIGKAKLSSALVENSHWVEGDALKAYRRYVEYGVELLEEMDELPSGVIAIVKYHQERHNGSGFPLGVTGDRIPLLAKIAGLVDHYQDLITPRDRHSGLSPLDAVTKLYELRNIEFQQDLVERFIEAVGVYPTGTLVELNTQEVGIVTGHNMDRRLFPKVMIILDEHKQPLKNGQVVDLKEWNQNNAERDFLLIKESLPKGAYDIDETGYLLTGAKSRWSWKHISATLAAS